MEIGWTLPQLMLLIVPISLIVLYAFIFAEKYTDESHSEFIVRKKEQAQISSRERCKHSYYDMKTQEPINKTTDYLFAYKYMDVINTVNRQLVKINEEKDIQCRPIPSSRELAEQKLYYCPKCKKETYFNLEAICKTAIAERKSAEEIFAKQKIESKHRSGLR